MSLRKLGIVSKRRPAKTKKAVSTDGDDDPDYQPSDAEEEEEEDVKREEKGNESKVQLNCHPIPYSDTLTFADISGLEREKERILRAFVYPTQAPRLFTGQSKSMLLYGPAGTGKSILSRALVREILGAIMTAPTTADLKSEYFGASSNLLKQSFDCVSRLAYQKDRENRLKTGTTLGILFLDEIEAIAAKRQPKEVEQGSIVTTLLQLMQGVENLYPNVAVIGSTNQPWALDSAVLRRFRTSIFIDVPQANARRDIIVKLLRRLYTPLHLDSGDPYIQQNTWKLVLPNITIDALTPYLKSAETQKVVASRVDQMDSSEGKKKEAEISKERLIHYTYFAKNVLQQKELSDSQREMLHYREGNANVLVELLVIWSGAQPARPIIQSLEEEMGFSKTITRELVEQLNATHGDDMYKDAKSPFGYSGSDLDNVIKEAIDSSAQELIQKGFKRCNVKRKDLNCFSKYMSCSLALVDQEEQKEFKKEDCVSFQKLSTKDRQDLQNFTITVKHFEDAFKRVKSTILPDEYADYIYYDLTGRRIPRMAGVE